MNSRDAIEFSADGVVRLWTPTGEVVGSYAAVSRSRIQVDFGERRPWGEPKTYRALVRGDHLLVCELVNYRHCLQYHRPGKPVYLLPR